MGRKRRHSARTGDGGAEIRHRKKQLKLAEQAKQKAEDDLEFYDDPSDDELAGQQHSDGDDSDAQSEEELLELGEEDEDEEEEDDEEEEEQEPALNDDDDDDEVDAEDFEEEKQKAARLDGKWGKSKRTYYSADTAEYELDSDEEAAQDEEEAALEIQKKQAEMMEDGDFGLDEEEEDPDEEEEEEDQDEEEDQQQLLAKDDAYIGEQLADLPLLVEEEDATSTSKSRKQKHKGVVERVQKDFSKLSRKEKLEIVQQSAPELMGLMAEMQQTLEENDTKYLPLKQKLQELYPRKTVAANGKRLISTKHKLAMNYAANIAFYLLIKAEGKSVVDHPVLEHLLLMKNQLKKLDAIESNVEQEMNVLMSLSTEEAKQLVPTEYEADAKSLNASKKSSTTKMNKTQPKKQKKAKTLEEEVDDQEIEQAADFYEQVTQTNAQMKQAKQAFYSKPVDALASSSDDSDSDEEGKKRGATYQIMKNKGLKAHKNKINRNPRVKKRMQYRKAVIRRKGQVRDVRVGEASQYGGETTGIKANLTRSRKLRN